MAEPANSSSASVGQTAVKLTSGGKCFEQTHTVNFLDLDIITSTISGCNVKQKNFHGMKTSVLKEFMISRWLETSRIKERVSRVIINYVNCRIKLCLKSCA